MTTTRQDSSLALCRKCDRLKPAYDFVFGGEEVDWCKDCYAELNKDYKKKHGIRNARKRLSGETIDREAVIERDRSICHICGREVNEENIHIDHIIPLSKGGTHTMDNVAVAHKWCNMHKHNRFFPVQLALFGARNKLLAMIDKRRR